MAISVRVARIPGQVIELALDDGATVAQALSKAELSVENGETLKVQGMPATPDKVLNDGDRVVLVKGAKGNAYA
jgi:hypothetical protein